MVGWPVLTNFYANLLSNLKKSVFSVCQAQYGSPKPFPVKKFGIKLCKPDKCYVTLNLSAMQSQDRKSELRALELELAQKEISLEEFFNANEVFRTAKAMLDEIDKIKDKIEELKNKNG